MAGATPGAAAAAPPGPSQAAERAVRRRVGPTAEESRAVTRATVEEPEDEEQAGDDLLPEVPETSSGTSTDTGVEVEAVDTTAAASALINIAEAAFANLADYNVVISEAMPGTEKYEDFWAFFSDRLEEPAVKEWKKRKASYVKKKQKEKNGKLLDYAKCSDELKRKLDETRAKEWSKWKEFGASVVIDSKQLQELLDEGHQVIESGSFKYCGKEIVQDEDFTIHVSCADTTRAIKKIPIAPRRRPGDPLTDSEKTQLKSVAGSLAWVSRQCRPDLAYRVAKIQTASNKGTVADLRQANKSIEYAQDTYQRGLVFKSGVLDWETPGGLVQVVVTDASHANEEEEMLVNGMVSIEGHRSQGARMVFLASPDIWDGNKGFVHPIAWASNVVRRVCRSTIQAEAYTLQSGVEDGDVIRAAVTDLFGKLDLKRWQATSAAFIRQLWLTDCKSLEETLQNPKCAKHSDKRLSIEIASLRQDLWRQKGQETGDPFEEDYKPKDADLTDKVRWIDTDVMVADPLTKVMEPVKLVHVLETNELDVEQPLDSVLKKRAKQLQRRKGDPEEDT